MTENIAENTVEETAAAVTEVVETAKEPYVPVAVTIKTMLEAGAHFGHKAERWHPKMLPFIFGVRNKVHIINLDTTLEYWEKARKFVVDVTSRGGRILFVGTKPQAREAIKEAAERCGAYYVNNRWLGGTLSNLATIRNSISRMNKLQDLLRQAENKEGGVRIAKKERLAIAKQVEKLITNLGGIKDMVKPPEVVFIVDICKETIAVAESLKLHIPVIALVDTNVDPSKIKFPIPSNDDATGAIQLFANAIADAAIEGHKVYEARMTENNLTKREERAASDDKGGEPVVERRGRSDNNRKNRGGRFTKATNRSESKEDEEVKTESADEATEVKE